MKNNPLDILYREHEIITKTEHEILKLRDTWLEDPDEFKVHVEKLLIFFQFYADGVHHRKEEDFLFPAIMNHPDFTLQEMIHEFENHHEEFRDYLSSIRDEIQKSNWAAAYKLLWSYSLDLRDHIAAENEELFVLAENLFNEDEMDKLYFRFKDIDMETGEARLSELEKMVSDI